MERLFFALLIAAVSWWEVAPLHFDEPVPPSWLWPLVGGACFAGLSLVYLAAGGPVHVATQTTTMVAAVYAVGFYLKWTIADDARSSALASVSFQVVALAAGAWTLPEPSLVLWVPAVLVLTPVTMRAWGSVGMHLDLTRFCRENSERLKGILAGPQHPDVCLVRIDELDGERASASVLSADADEPVEIASDVYARHRLMIRQGVHVLVEEPSFTERRAAGSTYRGAESRRAIAAGHVVWVGDDPLEASSYVLEASASALLIAVVHVVLGGVLALAA